MKRYVFVGEEIPLDGMQKLLAEVYGRQPADIGQENGITANEYGVLQPSKSVVFFALAWKAERQISRLLFLEEGARLCFGNPKTPRSTMRAEKFCSRWSQKVSVPTIKSMPSDKHV